MRRQLTALLFLAAALPLFAQTPTLGTSIDPPLELVEAGEARIFRTIFRNLGPEPATDVRVRYEIDGGGAIERIDGGHCVLSGSSAECTAASLQGHSSGSHIVIARTGSDNGSAATLTMTVTAGPVNAPLAKAVGQAKLQFFLVAEVKSFADSGPGSLRAAIETANSATRPVKITFRLPPPVPAEGWFTLIPESPLPPITGARVFVDGKSATRYMGETNPHGPEVAIDGRLAHRGLEIHSRCLARVQGLAIGNFDANQGLWFTKNAPCENFDRYLDVRDVTDNYIGTDPTGSVAWPNLRGLRGDFGSGAIRNNVISGNTYSGIWIWAAFDQYESFTIEGNRLGTAADGVAPLPNGAAGMLFGDRVAADVRQNVIANHPGMGIALARGETFVNIRQNSMRDNGGLGIDWGIDGISPLQDDQHVSQPNAPTLMTARYDAGENRTYFIVVSTTATYQGPLYFDPALDLYANRGPDGDGEQWLNIGGGKDISEGTFELWVAGDLRGQWVNATVTRIPNFGFLRTPRTNGELVTFGDESTSELSNAILVQ